MKKLLTVFTVIALTSALAATAAESRLENFVNKKLSPVTTKEKEINSKIEAQQKANAAKQQEYKKQQAARQAQLEKQKKEYQKQQAAQIDKQKKDAQAKHQATKKAVDNEVSFWKSMFSKK